MSEEPQVREKKNLRGWPAKLAWFVVLFAVFLVGALCLILIEGDARGWELVSVSVLGALVLSVLVCGGFWLIRWLCNGRNLARFVFAVACLVTLFALSYAFENWRGRHAWEKHRAEWEAKGETFGLITLLPPLVPDEQNLAMAPLLRPSMDFTNGPRGIVWRDTNALARLMRLSATIAPRRNTNDSLNVGSLEKGTFADVASWGQFYRGNTNYPQAPATASPAETVLVALSEFNGDLRDLAEAAAARPYTRFPIQYNAEPSWAILLPHLAHVKMLVTTLNVRATAELDEGKSTEALADLQLALRLSDGISREPLLIDHLVRIASLSVCLQTVREGLVRHIWSDAQLKELQAGLDSIDLLAEFEYCMRGELALEISGLDFLRRQGFRGNGMDYLGTEEGGSSSTPGYNFMPSGWYYQNMLTISRMFHDFLLTSSDAKAHRVYPEMSDKESQAMTALFTNRSPYNIFARLLLPALDRAVRKSARTQAFVDEAATACAIERYRLANNRLPETLAALVPAYLEKISGDVINGEPLHYHAQPDGGYLLYSVGWNKTDDGGKIVLTDDKKNAAVDVTKGDWVWKIPGR